jgi:hypothetical protein
VLRGRRAPARRSRAATAARRRQQGEEGHDGEHAASPPSLPSSRLGGGCDNARRCCGCAGPTFSHNPGNPFVYEGDGKRRDFTVLPPGHRSPCSFGLSATSQQYFSLRTNLPSAISQQYFFLRRNQHQPSATNQTNMLVVGILTPKSSWRRRSRPRGGDPAPVQLVLDVETGPEGPSLLIPN